MGVVQIEKALISDLGPTKETDDEDVSFVQQRAASVNNSVRFDSPPKATETS